MTAPLEAQEIQRTSGEYTRLAEDAERAGMLEQAVRLYKLAARSAKGAGRAARALDNAIRVEQLQGKEINPTTIIKF